MEFRQLGIEFCKN
uniref:Uncharacterized protein n=1 Tax=Rhizophora mucronata TaxID=61149 RepID=A0A2P2PYT3_RHIMU